MNSPAQKQVVLCADDYALNAPISKGIVSLAALGRLSATSVMTLSPRWGEDAAALRELRNVLDVGVHLDWTSSFAIDAGHGSSLRDVMGRALLRQYSQQSLENEMDRQFDAFEAHWHSAPNHIDGHQHIQQFPLFRKALANVVLRRYGACLPRPWLRVSKVAQSGLKAQVISSMGAEGLKRWAKELAWPTLSPLFGVYAFDGEIEDYARLMQRWLADLPATDPAVIMCHPASSIQAHDEIGEARHREFVYLSSDAFTEHLAAAAVRLGRGSDRTMAESHQTT